MGAMIISALVGAAVLAALHVLGSELRGRAPRLFHAIVRFAVRRLPEELRDEFADEWIAEVEAILAESRGLPATRAWSALKYGVDLFRSVRGVGEALADEPQEQLPQLARPRLLGSSMSIGDYQKLFGADVVVFPRGHGFAIEHIRTGSRIVVPSTPADPSLTMRAVYDWYAEQNGEARED